eukprot:TRINITY_DN9183_c0_g1_i4.p1 TRINITY_DN9183_c0_g1~~TRINITY_DN9183_c0_g1_i4.p1  ORF type:complete len:197 (+),score=33.49 TRINITY_DN9183_c0_g1_i4:430-1020(+)
MCAIAGIFLASRVFLADEFPCQVGADPLCGEDTCTYMGSVHLAWRVKMRAPNLWTPGAWAHHFVMFAPALFTGNPVTAAFLFITGPIMGHYVTNWNISEWASIWCYFSILQIVCAVGLAHLFFWDKHLPIKSLTLKRAAIESDIKDAESNLKDLKQQRSQYSKQWQTSWENTKREPVNNKKQEPKVGTAPIVMFNM